jgi:hypothetical protein
MKFMKSTPDNRSFMIWTHEGGAIDDVGATDTAFPHRGYFARMINLLCTCICDNYFEECVCVSSVVGSESNR